MTVFAADTKAVKLALASGAAGVPKETGSPTAAPVTVIVKSEDVFVRVETKFSVADF